LIFISRLPPSLHFFGEYFMNLDPALALIKQFEGLRLMSYLCTGNRWTIGYGTTVYADGTMVQPGDTCTKAEAETLLAMDIKHFVADVRSLVKVPVTNNQLCALISFAYNVGSDIDADKIAEGLGDSTLLKKLNAGDYAGAADEFPKWNKSGGKVTPGLTRRREAERKLFLTP
jgi:lysozyme